MKSLFLVTIFTIMTPGLLSAVTTSTTETKMPEIEVLVDGATTNPLVFQQLIGANPEVIDWEHKGAVHHFTGVSLEKAVGLYGLTSGPKQDDIPITEKRSGYKFVIVASAPDGYQAVFSYAELASTNLSPSKAYLVWAEDDKAISDGTGPYRLVVKTDGEGARSLHNLKRLDIIDMRKISKPLGESNDQP